MILFVRPSLIRTSTILASVQGPYNAVWVKGMFGEDTFYYGWGAGHPTGVAVVSDLVRGGGGNCGGSPERGSPFAAQALGGKPPDSGKKEKAPDYLSRR